MEPPTLRLEVRFRPLHVSKFKTLDLQDAVKFIFPAPLHATNVLALLICSRLRCESLYRSKTRA